MIDYSDCTIPILRNELKKRGHWYSRLNKSKLVAKLQKVVEEETFPQFPKFPAEVRQEIFKQALPPRRVVSVEVYFGLRVSYNVDHELITSIMLSCKEARDAVFLRHRPTGYPISWNMRLYNGRNDLHDAPSWKIAKLSLSDDILLLRDVTSNSINSIVSNCNFVQNIQTIGFYDPYIRFLIAGHRIEGVPPHALPQQYTLQSLLKFPSLEEVVVFGYANTSNNLADKWNMIRTFAKPRTHSPCIHWANNYSENPPPAWIDDGTLALWKTKLEDPLLEKIMKVKLFFVDF